jgi:hypothetical protein
LLAFWTAVVLHRFGMLQIGAQNKSGVAAPQSKTCPSSEG